jgi:predicted permease
MGTVYLARDVKLGRQVAIKVVSPEVVSGIGVQQFLKEARYTARLQHQNILGLYDAGEAAGHPYYVMPYIKGGSLRCLLDRHGRLTLGDTLRIAGGLAKALDHAHQHHVLHCDVKPENILLGEEHVYVADFGISRAIHAETFEWGRRNEIDSSAGTPAYVSPEQASGEQNLDERADVYSVGCVVFEMLTGRSPFTGRNTMEIVAQRFTSEVPDLREYAPDVPPAVAAAIERAMSLAPGRRTPSAMAFHRDLEVAAAPRTGFARSLQRAAFVADATARRIRGRGRRRSRSILRGGFVDGLWQDVRLAFRSMRRVPTFAVMAILTLALGMGANTAIFTVVNAVLLQPLPWDRPEELAMIWELDREGQMGIGDPEWTVAPANYVAWRERSNSFSDLGAFNVWGPTLSGDGEPERLVGSIVTPNLFRLLGVMPALGTGFAADHAVPGNDRVVILSHGLWQRRFGGDASVVGRAVRLNGTSYTVLGVLPEAYRHPEPSWIQGTQIFAPIAWEDPRNRHGRYLRTIGRVRPGVSLEEAEVELAAVARQLETDFPETNRGYGIVLRSVHEELFGGVRRGLLLMLGAAGFVLLIVCVNVANLVLARSHGRRKEFAIRAALGAGRQRLARQLVAENVILALAGGIVGLAAVAGGTRFMRAAEGQYLSNVADIYVDATVIWFMMALAVGTGIVFGLLPVWQTSRADLRTPLLEESAGGGLGLRARRVRSGLVVAEVMLATVLVVGAGLLTRSFVSLIDVPIGFDADGLFTFQVTTPRWRYETEEEVRAFHDQLLPRLNALPGVENTALVSDLPFTTINQFVTVNPVDDQRPPDEAPSVEYRTVGSGYFRAMGIDVIAGRDIRPEDRGNSELVSVVNEAFAARFWPGQAALGKRFMVGSREPVTTTVIGVVADILDDGFDGATEPRIYRGFSQAPQWGTAVVLRGSVSVSSLAPAIRQEIRELDDEVLTSNFRMMDDVVAATVADERLALALAAAFSLLALALAGVGIYGVMSYAVAERQREIGIRGALGAQRADVMKLVLGHSGLLTLIGTLGGIVFALPLARFLGAFLYGVRLGDPVTLLAAPLALAGVAFMASYLPAARATRISPVEALRSER